METSLNKEPNSGHHEGGQPFPGGGAFRLAFPYLAMGVLLVMAIVMAGDQIVHHIEAIESWIASLGFWSVWVFVVFFVLATSFLLPESILAITAGALFGLGLGLVAVIAGGLLAAALQYALSKYLLRTRIQRMLAARPPLAAIQRAVCHDAFRLQVLLRLTPLNPATLSYLLGAVGVRFTGFLLASLAIVPHLILEVYFGYTAKHVARIAGRTARATHLHDLAIIGSLAACVVAAVIVSRMARKAVLTAMAETRLDVASKGPG